MTADTNPLFQPIKIKNVTIKNRIGMAPMHTKYASESGEVTDKLIEYFVARARGGVGLIVVENTCVDWDLGKGDGNPVTIHDDRFRPRLHELVKAVHKHGAKIITELHHVGRQTFRSNLGGRTPVSASAVQSEVGGDMPREMTVDGELVHMKEGDAVLTHNNSTHSFVVTSDYPAKLYVVEAGV